MRRIALLTVASLRALWMPRSGRGFAEDDRCTASRSGADVHLDEEHGHAWESGLYARGVGTADDGAGDGRDRRTVRISKRAGGQTARAHGVSRVLE